MRAFTNSRISGYSSIKNFHHFFECHFMPKLLEKRRFVIFAILAGSIAISGCSRGTSFPEATISGVVTVGGTPVPHGAINFSPIAAGQGAVAGGLIEDGQYHCDHVAVGKLTVTFTLQAKEPRRFVDATGAAREVPVSLLADQYRAGVKAETHEGENHLDFALDPPAAVPSPATKR